MAAINFPNTPVLNDEYTHPDTGTTYKWDGVKWRIKGTSGGGIGIYSVYPELDMTALTAPIYTYIGTVKLDANLSASSVSVLNILGPVEDIVAQLMVNRNTGNVKLKLLNDAMPVIQFASYTQPIDESILNLYIINTVTRNAFTISTTDNINVTLDNSLSNFALPLDRNDFGIIPFESFISETDLIQILSPTIEQFDSLSAFFEDQQRTILTHLDNPI